MEIRPILILIFAVGTLSNPVTINAPPIPRSDTNYRLDGSVIPSHYTLSLRTYFNTEDDRAFTFDGSVTIVIQPTVNNLAQIVLHSHDLIINESDVSIVSSSGQTIALNAANPLEWDETYRFLKINLATSISNASLYNLTISYIGQIRDEMAGFYRSSYMANGEQHWLGITQFESTNARKALPCFDEPGYKATFQVTILAPMGFSATLSNTRIEKTEPTADGWVSTTFLPTPKMSTYLLAFLVSDFEAGSREDVNGKEVGIWSKPDVKGFSGYAYDSAKSIVNALGEFLGIDYYNMHPNLNFDHIAIPDFSAGAMENWGLITYREAYLIYDPAESNLRYKQQITTIISHETAHMWFGNLVTCHWWSNTWLNEGFANYLQYFIGAIVEPTMGLEEQFVLTSVHGALGVDQVENSDPLTNEEVNSPGEISAHFGTITYSKGGSIIRMIEHLIGTDTLKKGLNTYLDANRFSSGYPDSLFAHLEQATAATDYYQKYDINLTDVYINWTRQSGFPLVTVSVNFDSGEVKLTQERFYITPETKSDEVYLVPITFAMKSDESHSTKPNFILDSREASYTKDSIKEEWIVANVNQSGFYRVNYDDALWGLLIKTLNSDSYEEIPVLSRAQIVDDVFALARGDVITYAHALDVLDFLQYERSYFVWVPAVNGFNFMRGRLETSPESLEFLHTYILNLLTGIIGDLGLEENNGHDFITKRNQMLILELACSLGHESCIEYSVNLLRSNAENGSPIPPNQRPMVYCTGLKHGDHDDFLLLWAKYEESLIESEKVVILGNLGCATQEDSIHAFLDAIFRNDSSIRKQDANSAFSSAIQLKSNAEHVFSYVKENHQQIRTSFSLSTVLNGLVGSFTSDEDLTEFEEWINTNTELLTEGEIKSSQDAVASVKKNFAWTEAHLQIIKETLVIKNSASTFFSSLAISITSVLLIVNYF